MSRLDRDVLPSTLDEVATWMRHAAALMGWRTRILLEAQEAGRRLSSKVIDLRRAVPELGAAPELVGAEVVTALPHAVAIIEQGVRREVQSRAEAHRAGVALRDDDARALLESMHVDRLKDATADRLATAPLIDAGVTTVLKVWDRGRELEALPGVGRTTATRLRGAARTLWDLAVDSSPLRLDPAKRTPGATELLRRTRKWETLLPLRRAEADLALARALTPLGSALAAEHPLVLAPRDRTTAQFREAVGTVVALAGRVSARRPNAGPHPGSTASGTDGDAVWDDFLARPADYYALFAELGFTTEDPEKTAGNLPAEIVEAVRAFRLDVSQLNASLRGYQAFAAKFALVQGNVILGDEMGLGKTVEALAVLAHLAAHGEKHFLVVCPAAVVTNWLREIRDKTTLRAHRLHGPDREAAAYAWRRAGGVAVTTFDTLRGLELTRDGHDRMPLGCVVVDEAQCVKNPAAQRSKRVAALIEDTGRAVLLTGTPLMNRLEEFRTLVGYLQPDLVVDSDALAPARFRQQVAPAYLRRNQEDVLTELPELVEIEETLPMSAADERAYRSAVAEGNFMAMRQAAFASGPASEKLQRLVEIVDEAEENGRRVIVFSFFRDVLDTVAGALDGPVFGLLTGSVPAAQRQSMVDAFSTAPHGAALVAQVTAGGVGLNIQSASVVVLCEPQLNPAMEWQAIARARRMGQLDSVQVYRLVSEDGVDRRLRQMLGRKAELFEQFARESDVAEAAPEAVDISEAALARQVIAAEQERLMGRQDGAALTHG